MKKQTFWLTLIGILSIPLLPFLVSNISKLVNGLILNRVDDWVYGEASLTSSLFTAWLELDWIGKALVVLLALFLIAYIGFPLYKFAQGLISQKGDHQADESRSAYESREWRKHRLWLGAPAVYVAALFYIIWVVYAFQLHRSLIALVENNETAALWTSAGIGVVFLLLILWLFLGGLYSWIRNGGNEMVKRTGRNKFLFSFYYLTIFLILVGLGGFTLMGPGDPMPMDAVMTPGMASFEGVESDSIGLAVGGASDIDNFRENIDNGYLPVPTDITHEGLFYDYKFDTGQQERCDDLFCPSYSTAISKDPFSDQEEYFLSVGLNSGLNQEDFDRKKLNLVVILDISGSMRSSFDRYYYDRFRTDQENVAEAEKFDNRTKMEIANESVVTLMDRLEPEDRFGMVLFESKAHLAKGLRRVENTDMGAIKNHVLKIRSTGGTNMEAGYRAGTELLQEFKDVDKDEYENRIIFLTDAMPNLGQTSKEGLFGLTKQNANEGIYTTFIGIGVDFNTELINEITKVRGANYYSVHSAEEFHDRMDDGFEYMVTPLVFDLTLNLESEGYDIRAVYGSPEADVATGEIMKVNTLFPSERTDGETRGGLVLLHLDKLSDDADLNLRVSYEDRSGSRFTNDQKIEFDSVENEERFDNSGIHKGVVLARYVNVMKDWVMYETELAPEAQIEIPITRYNEEGIPVTEVITELGKWERTSNRLTLSDDYYPVMISLKEYVNEGIDVIGDESMRREIEVIDKIISAGQR